MNVYTRGSQEQMVNIRSKQNCWEFKQCGRGPAGRNGPAQTPCPAATDSSCDMINGGKNAGRICWIVAGTFCDLKVQGTFAQKRRSCITCDFFKLVEAEQGIDDFMVLKPGQKYVPVD